MSICSPVEVAKVPANSRLGAIYKALEVTPDGDARTALLDALREEMATMHDDGLAVLAVLAEAEAWAVEAPK